MDGASFWIAFGVLGLAALASGAGVFRVDSMARATFLLLASFLCVAGEVLLLGLSYLAVLVALMMVMEMVLMAVFMIMYMMNPAGLMPMAMLHNQRGSVIISLAVFVLLGAGAFLVPWPDREVAPPMDPTLALGEALMGPQMLVMMTLGLALFATMIAAVMLATPRGRYARDGDRPGWPPDEAAPRVSSRDDAYGERGGGG